MAVSVDHNSAANLTGDTCMHIVVVHSTPGHEERLLALLNIAEQSFRGPTRDSEFERLLLTQACTHARVVRARVRARVRVCALARV
eukprot:3205394-Prymnesium_polylepis.1